MATRKQVFQKIKQFAQNQGLTRQEVAALTVDDLRKLLTRNEGRSVCDTVLEGVVQRIRRDMQHSFLIGKAERVREVLEGSFPDVVVQIASKKRFVVHLQGVNEEEL